MPFKLGRRGNGDTVDIPVGVGGAVYGLVGFHNPGSHVNSIGVRGGQPTAWPRQGPGHQLGSSRQGHLGRKQQQAGVHAAAAA